jgi:hypothetical protein
MTAALRPARSMPSSQLVVCTTVPAKVSMPAMSGIRGWERKPVAVSSSRAWMRSPSAVVTLQCRASSSHAALSTTVPNRMWRRTSYVVAT